MCVSNRGTVPRLGGQEDHGGTTVDAGQRNFGVSDLEYDIITTLGNLLEGSDALQKYEKDAQQAGDDECARLFRTIRDQNRQSATQLRQALVRIVGSG